MAVRVFLVLILLSWAGPALADAQAPKSLKDLPKINAIWDYNPSLVTTVYARDGQVLGRLYRQERYLVELDDMPDHVVNAFLASEDSAFYEHEGIDISAIFRAFTKNLQAGEIVQGGSTITQQVVKRLMLSSEKSYMRKLKEAVLSYRLEQHLEKRDILNIYLNEIFLGAGAYGVEAAARTYFGKHAEELTLAEAAVLAGLPKAPSTYNPFRFPDEAKARQRYVLQRLLELEWITPEQHDAALEQELVYESMHDESWGVGAWYLEEVRRWLIDNLTEETLKARGITLDRYGEDAVYELGLEVHTAVDLQHQAAAEAAVKMGLEASTKRRGWHGPIETVPPGKREEYRAAMELPRDGLQPGAWVKALVLKVEKDGAAVAVGPREGYIPVDTMSWCREPNPERIPEYVPAVKDAHKVVKPGDVVWASLVPPPDSEDEEQASGTAEAAESTNIDNAAAQSNTMDNATVAAAKPSPYPGDQPLPLALEQWPRVQGALVSMDPNTGDVLAMVGGYQFGENQFNRATQAIRQPGSAFKPIVYSAALDNGFTAASVIEDSPFVYYDEGSRKMWTPKNYSSKYYGPTLLANALAKSRNLVTIKVAREMGIHNVIERALAMGLEADFPENLPVSLGSIGVSPINLCQAYTAFPRGGTSVEPQLVLSVKLPGGRTIYRAQPEIREAMSPQNAYVMTMMLRGVVLRGTGGRAQALGRPVAGKTGTTNEERDAWFMGFAPYLLTGVYVGFDQIQPMGRLETGSRAALPIWLAYRQQVEDNYEPQDFKSPGGVQFVTVDETGHLVSPASQESWSLPFIAGTAPTLTFAEDDSIPDPDENLLKQIGNPF